MVPLLFIVSQNVADEKLGQTYLSIKDIGVAHITVTHLHDKIVHIQMKSPIVETIFSNHRDYSYCCFL